MTRFGRACSASQTEVRAPRLWPSHAKWRDGGAAARGVDERVGGAFCGRFDELVNSSALPKDIGRTVRIPAALHHLLAQLRMISPRLQVAGQERISPGARIRIG